MSAPSLADAFLPPPDWLQVNPGLDREAARSAFAAKGRLSLADIFVPDAAERVRRSLDLEVEWTLSALVDGQPRDVEVAWLVRQPPQTLASLQQSVMEPARRGAFSYAFDTYRIDRAAISGQRRGWAVEQVYDRLNTEAFLTLVRDITGDDRGVYVDAQATRYQPGHFLTRHDDNPEGKDRLYAYVLGFTPGWRAEFGGLLAFLDDAGQVEEAFVPGFNSLHIFAVPRQHLVTPVAPYAPRPRHSITGWVRSKPERLQPPSS